MAEHMPIVTVRAVREMVEEQASDARLWSEELGNEHNAHTMYLQTNLRLLHAIIGEDRVIAQQAMERIAILAPKVQIIGRG